MKAILCFVIIFSTFFSAFGAEAYGEGLFKGRGHNHSGALGAADGEGDRHGDI